MQTSLDLLFEIALCSWVFEDASCKLKYSQSNTTLACIFEFLGLLLVSGSPAPKGYLASTYNKEGKIRHRVRYMDLLPFQSLNNHPPCNLYTFIPTKIFPVKIFHALYRGNYNLPGFFPLSQLRPRLVEGDKILMKNFDLRFTWERRWKIVYNATR